MTYLTILSRFVTTCISCQNTCTDSSSCKVMYTHSVYYVTYLTILSCFVATCISSQYSCTASSSCKGMYTHSVYYVTHLTILSCFVTTCISCQNTCTDSCSCKGMYTHSVYYNCNHYNIHNHFFHIDHISSYPNRKISHCLMPQDDKHQH